VSGMYVCISQYDKKHVAPTSLSGIREGKRERYMNRLDSWRERKNYIDGSFMFVSFRKPSVMYIESRRVHII
jgi:hypothetical protein